MSKIDLLHGDCLEKLKELPDSSVDAVVTDPPYGLSFMGKKWDYDVPSQAIWEECLRVLKPGGHLLAFFGSRTYHRGVVRIEDAGFEIRDQIMWVYGSGFPKSLNLDGEWEGWGTALKPAHEPIVVARKPLDGTVANNVLQHGVGGLNIDGCRVEAETRKGTERGVDMVGEFVKGQRKGGIWNSGPQSSDVSTGGRWPANFVHDGSVEVVAGFPDSKAGGSVSGNEPSQTGVHAYGVYGRVQFSGHADSGSAARFFYCAKASKADRDEGCEELIAMAAADRVEREEGSAGMNNPRAGAARSSAGKNFHPTVKPTELMRWLVRLVSPPHGVVLDPFMGSGSTGKACVLEGFSFVGIEREADYLPIARARIAYAETLASEEQVAAAPPPMLALMTSTP